MPSSSKTLPKRCQWPTGTNALELGSNRFTGDVEELLMIRKSRASIAVDDSLSLLRSEKVIDLAKNRFPISQLQESKKEKPFSYRVERALLQAGEWSRFCTEDSAKKLKGRVRPCKSLYR
jgi:hypothetical protein